MNPIAPLRATAICAAALLALAACASNSSTADGSQAASPRTSRGHSSCFDPRSARGFTPGGDDVLIVDTGTNHYRVQLDATCFGADFAPAMQFRGDSITGFRCALMSTRSITRGCGRVSRMRWILCNSFRKAPWIACASTRRPRTPMASR